ncbi:unnamed protein product [Ascophyllum nodosum]
MAYFKRCTSTPATTATAAAKKVNAVIMGRKTWQSIPKRFQPLEGRRNIVLSRNPKAREDLSLPQGVLLAGSLSEALSMLALPPHSAEVDEVFVIGGGMVYNEAVASELCKKILLTSVRACDGRFDDCDVHFPALKPEAFKLVKKGEVHEEKGVEFSFDEYERVPHAAVGVTGAAATAQIQASSAESSAEAVSSVEDDKENAEDANSSAFILAKRKAEGACLTHPNGGNCPAIADATNSGAAAAPTEDLDGTKNENEEEMQYLRLVKEILDNGVRRGDRTGTGTLSKFGVQMRFSLREERFPLLTTKRVFWRGVAEELLWFISGCTNANVLKERGIHIWDGNGSREFLDNLGLTDREEGDLGPVYGFQWRHFGAEYTNMRADYTGKGVDQLAECIKKIKTNPEDRRIVLSAWNPADLGKMALPPCHMFCQFYVAEGELSCQMYQRSADMGLGVPFNIASYALLTRLVAQACDLKAGEFVHTIGDAHVYLNHVEALREQLRRKPRPFPTLSIAPGKNNIDSFEYSDFELRGYSPHKTIKMKMAV